MPVVFWVIYWRLTYRRRRMANLFFSFWYEWDWSHTVRFSVACFAAAVWVDCSYCHCRVVLLQRIAHHKYYQSRSIFTQFQILNMLSILQKMLKMMLIIFHDFKKILRRDFAKNISSYLYLIRIFHYNQDIVIRQLVLLIIMFFAKSLR